MKYWGVNGMRIAEIKTVKQFQGVFPVLQQLRTNLSEEEALSLWNVMKGERYQLFAMYSEHGAVVTLAGVAICTNFYNEKHVFLYDLITAKSHRSKGYGEKMLSYIEMWGREHDCSSVVLTSAFVRKAAHRFYEREGYEKVSYAFRKQLLL